MLDNTNIDEIVEYPSKALRLIGTDEDVVGLLTNNPLIDLDSDEADEVFDKYLFDYQYVDDTTQKAEAFIWAEMEVGNVPTATMKDCTLYVTVCCHKEYMELSPSVFRGLAGNRRDNLVRAIDKVLDGSNLFGVGKLELESVQTVSAPTHYTSRLLTYRAPEFLHHGT